MAIVTRLITLVSGFVVGMLVMIAVHMKRTGKLMENSFIVHSWPTAPSTSSGASSTGIEWIFGLDDRLMTWSNDLKLYRIRPETNPLQQSIDGNLEQKNTLRFICPLRYIL